MIRAIEAQFTISVTDCTNGIKAIQAKQKTIAAGETTNVVFNIYSENSNSSVHVCKGKC